MLVKDPTAFLLSDSQSVQNQCLSSKLTFLFQLALLWGQLQHSSSLNGASSLPGEKGQHRPHTAGCQQGRNTSTQRGSGWASPRAGGWLISFSKKVIKNYSHGRCLPHSLATEGIQHRNGTELSFHFCFAVHL